MTPASTQSGIGRCGRTVYIRFTTNGNAAAPHAHARGAGQLRRLNNHPHPRAASRAQNGATTSMYRSSPLLAIFPSHVSTLCPASTDRGRMAISTSHRRR